MERGSSKGLVEKEPRLSKVEAAPATEEEIGLLEASSKGFVEKELNPNKLR